MLPSSYGLQPYKNNYEVNEWRPISNQLDYQKRSIFDRMGIHEMDFGMKSNFEKPYFPNPKLDLINFNENIDKNFTDFQSNIFSQFPFPNSLGNGQSYQQTFMMKSVKGPDGRPHIEKYESKAVKAMKDGRQLGERQQIYQNSIRDYEKASHERILNHQGRSLVFEREGNDYSSHDLYKNLDERDSNRFDLDWDQERIKMGYNSNTGMKRLPYAADFPYYKKGYNPLPHYNEYPKPLPRSYSPNNYISNYPSEGYLPERNYIPSNRELQLYQPSERYPSPYSRFKY